MDQHRKPDLRRRPELLRRAFDQARGRDRARRSARPTASASTRSPCRCARASSPPAPEEFQQALIRLKQSSGLYLEQSKGAIEFFGSRLFRAHVYLPASAGAGLYRAEFYIYQNGKIVGETGADIQLAKIGIEAQLSAAALDFPWAYGAAAVIIAALTGGGASLIFRKT